MKLNLFLVAIAVTFFWGILAITVSAQGEPATEVPAPYTGLKNPFPWDDTSAQKAGERLYRSSCSGCHGTNGGNISGANFNTANFSQNLAEGPDYYFWVLSEGRLNKGMPPYKSSLSEEQRWQVLTYIGSLSKTATPGTTPTPTKPPVEETGGSLLLTAPKQARFSQPLTLTATLQDRQGKPIRAASVIFLIKTDFFISGLMEIGDAVTNDDGIAILEYTPRQEGDTQIIARYETIETTTTISTTGTAEPLYKTKVGIELPSPGEEVFIGPESAHELVGMGEAPTSAFRLPGSMLSWLLLFAATVMLIWVTYFRVMYHVFRISVVTESERRDTRLVPLVGLAIVVALGILLISMLITGPYTHLHLFR